MTLIMKPFPIQMCKNPWKRGGVYYRGRLAPWIGNPDALRPKQVERVTALTNTMIDKCTGVRGVTGGVANTALCLQREIPGKLTKEEKIARYEERLKARRKGPASKWYTGEKKKK